MFETRACIFGCVGFSQNLLGAFREDLDKNLGWFLSDLDLEYFCDVGQQSLINMRGSKFMYHHKQCIQNDVIQDFL